jgi:hypothetical protein
MQPPHERHTCHKRSKIIMILGAAHQRFPLEWLSQLILVCPVSTDKVSSTPRVLLSSSPSVTYNAGTRRSKKPDHCNQSTGVATKVPGIANIELEDNRVSEYVQICIHAINFRTELQESMGAQQQAFAT